MTITKSAMLAAAIAVEVHGIMQAGVAAAAEVDGASEFDVAMEMAQLKQAAGAASITEFASALRRAAGATK